MACPPPRSSSRKSRRSTSKASSKSAVGLLRRVITALVGKGALATYSTVAALAYVPQLDTARDWALGNAKVWVQKLEPLQQPLQTAEHWWAQGQDRINDWRERLEAIAQQSRDQALPSVSGTVGGGASSSHSNAGKKQDSSASFSQCAEQIPASAPLAANSVGATWLPVALCSDGFALLYSGLSKTPIVVVERLNRQRLQNASGQKRTDVFYADARLRSAYKAELSDYQHSGFDRGHMAAAANQSSGTGMAQSFALSNMVPQDPDNNRKVWAKLEGDVRKYANRATGNVYVYTGPLFEGTPHTIGKNQVWIPSHLYKLVFDERQQRAWGWVIANTASARLSAPLNYAEFVDRTGRNFLSHLH